MRESIALRFKGDRSYLHGTDFHAAVTERLCAGPDTWVSRIQFRRIARRACTLTTESPVAGAVVVCDGRVRRPGGDEQRFWVEETGGPVDGRYPYDESRIEAATVVEGTSARLVGDTPYSFVENLVAVTKVLSYATVPEIGGRWMFGQLVADAPLPEVSEELVVEQIGVVAGRFTVNRIKSSAAVLGEIRFIVGQP